MRTVKDIIDTKGPVTNVIDASSLVIDALHKLIEVNLSYLVVMEDGEFLGVFSERDYTRNVILRGRTSQESKVREVMSADLPTVSTFDTVEDCMSLMSEKRTRYLLAYDEGRFAAVITIHDLLRQVINSKEGVFNHTLAELLLDQGDQGKIY